MKIKHVITTCALASLLGVGALFGLKITNNAIPKESKAEAGKIYYFQNTRNWDNMYVHLFDGSVGDTQWPGEELTTVCGQDAGHDMYIFRTDKDYASFILNNGSGLQTVNLSFSSFTGDNNAIWINETTDDKGHFYGGGYFKYNYNAVEAGAYIRGSVIGWATEDQIPMTPTGNPNEYSITRTMAAGEKIKAVNYSALGASEAYIDISDLSCNHPIDFPVNNTGDVQFVNAGSYTITVNVSTGIYSVAANDYVAPTGKMVLSNGTDGENLSYNAVEGQLEITGIFAANTEFTLFSQRTLTNAYYGYEVIESDAKTALGSKITQGTLKSGSVYNIKIVEGGTYSIYLKDDGKIWMQTATDVTEAYAYAVYFLEHVGCDNSGLNAPSGWTDVANRYTNMVSPEGQKKIRETVADKDGDNLARCVYMYDLALKNHTSLTPFMTGRVSSLSNTLNVSAPTTPISPLIPTVIIVTGLLAVTVVGGYFYFKKKKEN